MKVPFALAKLGQPRKLKKSLEKSISEKSADLRASLWNAANTLRGSAVDRTDWKGYILPLLFFKRISDVWDEETAEAQEVYGETDPSLFPEIHRFVVPEDCHWDNVREVSANVGRPHCKPH